MTDDQALEVNQIRIGVVAKAIAERRRLSEGYKRTAKPDFQDCRNAEAAIAALNALDGPEQPKWPYMCDFHALAADHANWSNGQFGGRDVRGPLGSLKHLANEVKEAIAAPDDATEYADLLFLVLDASRRAGIASPALIKAARTKLETELKLRDWPEGDPDEPVEHVRGAV